MLLCLKMVVSKILEPQSPGTHGSLTSHLATFLFSAGCCYCFQSPCLGVTRLVLVLCSASRFCGSPFTGPQAAAFRLPGDDELVAAAAQSVGGGGQSPERKATQAHWRAGCSGRADCGPSGRGGLSQQVSEQAACSSLSCLVFGKQSLRNFILFHVWFYLWFCRAGNQTPNLSLVRKALL